ncbi:hypothetical protein [Lacticaseibacillus songhuajiangensis]|uniref:hypothetical protein n=1 Tax=Lacticaseibacillus songhuajiangensis TaxID=1296539 RepID=UPI000F7A10A8|nr:hypothetical protein [Lacticaseibacillus songhuajiangensis]
MNTEQSTINGTPKPGSKSTEINLRLVDIHESLLWLLEIIKAEEHQIPKGDIRAMVAVEMHKHAIHDFLQMTAAEMVQYDALEVAQQCTVYLNDDDRPQYAKTLQEEE